mgnify:CR=1 FL=1
MCNDLIINLSVEAFDLLEGGVGPNNIPDANFWIDDVALACSTGDQMTSVIDFITPLIVGNNSAGVGQEELFVCLSNIPGGLPFTSYTAMGANAWQLTTNPPT